MDTKAWFKKLNKLVNKIYYGEKKGNIFLPETDSERGYGWELAEERAKEILSGEGKYILIPSAFTDLQEYHMEYFYYYAITFENCFHGNCPKAQEELALSSAYGYLDQAFSRDFRKRGGNSSERLNDVVFILHQLIQAGWWQEAEELMGWIMEDVLTKDPEKMTFIYLDNLIIAQMTWFILRLSAKIFGYELDDSYYPFLQSENPPEWRFYTETLENWDTDDLELVDKYTYLLSDIYIMDGAKGETKSNKDYSSSEGLTISNYLYPFPILTWLKLREHRGLENPKEYSHELMNHPLASFFESSLEKPKNLPFVKELTKYLLKKEPSFPIPTSFIE